MATNQNPCPLCRYYDQPGWIINAWLITPCFQCNPGNCCNLPRPRQIADTAEGQARTVRCVDKCLPYKVLMTCGHIETRMMRMATAGVDWTPETVITARAACAECDPTKRGAR